MSQNPSSKPRKPLPERDSFTITLRAYSTDVVLCELVNYLKALDRSLAKQKIEEVLIMALLPLAKQHSGKYSHEQLRLSCLEAENSLTKHSSYLRQALMVAPAPQVSYPYAYAPLPPTNNISTAPNVNNHHDNGSSEDFSGSDLREEQTSFTSHLQDKGSIEDVTRMFGD